MQTFKKVLVFLGVNLLLLWGMTFLLGQPSVLKILLKQAKSPEYDTLILGQSHGETCLDPFVLSEQTGWQVFSLSRRLQPVTNLPYLLEEANTAGQYRRVILEIDPAYWDSNSQGEAGMDARLLFRLTGQRRLKYLSHELGKVNYNTALGDYALTVENLRRIPGVVRCKLSPAYRRGEDAAAEEIGEVIGTARNFRYQGRGFRYGVRKTGVEWNPWYFSPADVKEENLQALETIADYCQARDMELICVITAMPPQRIQTENLGESHDYYAALCSRYGVPLYDMNYVRPSVLPRTDEDYADIDGHMLGPLAQRHSRVLGEILTAQDKAGFFYSDFEDVRSHAA